jgi:hypothetical protein
MCVHIHLGFGVCMFVCWCVFVCVCASMSVVVAGYYEREDCDNAISTNLDMNATLCYKPSWNEGGRALN